MGNSRGLVSMVVSGIFAVIDGGCWLLGIPSEYVYLGLLAVILVVPVVWMAYVVAAVVWPDAEDRRRRDAHRPPDPALLELAKQVKIYPDR